MGKVYLARHTLIGRKAAVKILNPDIASDEEAVSRFFTEARLVNDIRHPNIVEITDFGQFSSYYCIVMELLEGETLAARLHRSRTLDEATAVRIFRQVTSALGAAHEQGMVHRDVKPENIFLRNHPDYPDFVKVLDFGIAKLLGGNSRGRAPHQDRHGDRHAGVHVARAMPGRGVAGPAQRHLLAGRRALRSAHRAAAVRRATRWDA